MCKTTSTINELELKADIENNQFPKSKKNYNSEKSMPDKFNEESFDEQTRCFVLGYN